MAAHAIPEVPAQSAAKPWTLILTSGQMRTENLSMKTVMSTGSQTTTQISSYHAE
jgi:hypothetical protein